MFVGLCVVDLVADRIVKRHITNVFVKGRFVGSHVRTILRSRACIWSTLR